MTDHCCDKDSKEMVAVDLMALSLSKFDIETAKEAFGFYQICSEAVQSTASTKRARAVLKLMAVTLKEINEIDISNQEEAIELFNKCNEAICGKAGTCHVHIS